MDKYNYEDGVGRPVKRAVKTKAADKREDVLRAEAKFENRPRGIQGGIVSVGGARLMNATANGHPALLTNRYRDAGRPFTHRRVELTSGHIRWLIIDPWGQRLWITALDEREADAMVAESNAAYGIGDDQPW